jgi:stage III sporulation protein AH
MIRRSNMKNIFKKNHIIITALAIMIVIAGYLSFTNRDAADNKDAVTVTDAEDYEEFTQVDSEDVLVDSKEGTQIADSEETLTVEGEDMDASDEVAANDNEEQLADENTDAEELADLSDEELTAGSQKVTDNGELDLEEGVPGEAVLTNAVIDAGYFISSKIDREQVRAKNKETYMQIMESPEVTKEQKQMAIDAMLKLTNIAEKENTTEKLLEAKGFDGAVVFINDDKVEVVVNAAALTDQQLAIIENVVKDKTGVSVENIGISTVVLAE